MSRIMAVLSSRIQDISNSREPNRQSWEYARSTSRAAIAALLLTGSAEGSAALHEIAERHSDQSLRGLARIALGKEIGDTHD